VVNRTHTALSAVTWTLPIQVLIRVDEPAAAGPTPVRFPVGDPALAEALFELESGRGRTYYDVRADREARDEYYAEVRDNLTPAARYRVLSTLLRDTHANTPPYKPARHVYPWVDLRPNRKLLSIYSRREFEPEELIRRDIATERAREEALARRAAEGMEGLEAFEEALEATMPFNCEHVVPQSWFAKREPMRGDLHHLFACEPRCNSFRGNTPYFDFAGSEEAVMTDCGRREGNRFEPRGGRGTVARATLYFLIRYPGEIDGTGEFPAERLETLLAWHAADPPGEYEQHRNWAIAEKQGNRNPLIDFPDWASRIDFRFGLD
jgi:endonuclease I